MNELQLPICALFFSSLLCIVFFSKKRLDLIENKIYSVMLITGLIDSIIITIERFLVIDGDINSVTPFVEAILKITNKLDFGVLLILTTCAFLYTLLITYPKTREKINNWITATLILDVIVYCIILMLDVNLISMNNIISVSGSAIVVTYIFGGLYLIASAIMALINIRNLTRRHIPIMSAIFIFIFLIFVFNQNPYIMVISITIAFVNYLMYFTIENPDIKMIDELTKAKAMVEKNNNDKSIFIFNTAQQIRQPLNMIEQRTEQILEDDNIESIKEKAIDIRTSGQKISYILNGAMDVSTMDAKKIKIVENQYKIANLLNEISIKSEKEAAKKNLEFRTNFDEAMPEMLYGDSIRLKQIINALISNAIKYTQKGFVELNVNSVVSFDVCRLIISVKDSGIGVKTEEINKLFQSDNKEKLDLEAVDEKDITLDIAKKMVNLIGGTITVRSEKNRGSEFTLIVDQRIVSDDNKIMDMVDEYKNLNNKPTILFVSDNEEERNFYNKRLNNISLITLVASGQECLQKIRKKEKYDLLIIKEKMDKLDAYKTIEKLENIEDFNSPIIILTEDKESKEILIRKGYNAISKDITQAQLVKIVNNLKKTNLV